MTAREQYQNYLRSDHWQNLRCEAVKHWGDRCNNCNVPKVEVHHLRYGKWFDVTIEDLLPLCDRCHEAVHASQRLSEMLESEVDSQTKRKTVLTFLAGRDEALKVSVKRQTPAQAYAEYRADQQRVMLTKLQLEIKATPRKAPSLVTQPKMPVTQLVEVTAQNHKRLRYKKEMWHWYKDNGINPRKAGWMKRCIGRLVPKHFLR